MIEKIERSILDRISQAAADRKLLCSPERVDTYKGEPPGSRSGFFC